ncbi:MAG TPA: CaiB/BaiF CoA-transferase family protein [Candidatus Acidoferrales bacterium]|nr:CaiB/BaiF CoA-transferase family protein [Candidatus Acidoferrales bacterium]
MKPLQGVRILDLSRLVPGPYCTRLLCDMGAEVIKVEEPGRGDYIRSLPPYVNDVSVAFELLNHGKKSITLNLEKQKGQEILRKLVASADVFLESFRPGTTQSLGCDFETIRKSNPQIVYCSLTGFGQTGPYKDLPGHDINVTAISGFLSLNGREPTVPSLQVGDLASGMLAALTITTALFARQRIKQAQYIDASILDVMLSWLSLPLALQLGGTLRMLGGDAPFYRLYRTRDSRLVALGAIEAKFWEGFCKLIDRPDLQPDQYSSEPRRTEVINAIQSVFLAKSADEWFKIMSKHGLPCTPILSLDEAVRDPQVRSRKMILDKDSMEERKFAYLGNPCKISGLGEVDLSPSPRLGEHSATILQEIGYSDTAIRGFAEDGVT